MKARELDRLLKAHGGHVIPGRGKGSHRRYTHAERERNLTVPWHRGKDIHPGLLRDILKQAGIT